MHSRIPPPITHLEYDWLDSTIGQYLMTKEQSLYDNAVADLFGFNALQMGGARMGLLSSSRIPNRYRASEFVRDTPDNHVYCSDDFLPFADGSLDLLLLPHRLEFSERPHQTLREAERVIMPDGHLLISGFNPLSLWGLESSISKLVKRKPSYPWHGNFIGLTRVKDWLTLLGFEVMSVNLGCNIPPFEHAHWYKKFECWEEFSERYCAFMGGIYFIVAKKRVPGMTRLKPVWKTPTLPSALIVRPSQSTPTQFGQTQNDMAEPKADNAKKNLTQKNNAPEE
jgi:SAM-dependent methyltransferase